MYLRMNAESGNIEFTRPFALNMSDFNIEASGSIGFTTKKQKLSQYFILFIIFMCKIDLKGQLLHINTMKSIKC